MLGAIFLIVLALLLIGIVISCVQVVPQAYAYIVEFFGSYRTTWEHGLHFKIPFVERIASRVSLKEQPKRTYKTYNKARRKNRGGMA